MAINRFNRAQATRGYQPLSFQELAYAPTQMRQREDAVMNARDKMLNDMNNFTGIDEYGEEVEGAKEQLRGRIDTLSNKIKEHGVGNMHYMDDFRSFRNDYNQAVSETGVLGMSSAIKNSLDQNKASYYADAQKKGLPPAAIDRNWAKEVAKYKEKLPGKLGEFKGSLPSFSPSLAPDKVDIPEKAIKYNQLLGMIKTQNPGSQSVPVYGEDGKFQGYEFYDTNGETISNDKNINYFKKLMASEILDPNSDMRRYADYIGKDPKQLMFEVDMVGGMMRKHQENQNPTKRSGGAGTKKTSERHGGDVTNLRSTSNASAEIPNSHDSISLMQSYAEIDRIPQGEITEEEREAQKRAALTAYNNRQKIEGTETFQENMDQSIANPKNEITKQVFEKYNINSWSDYQDFMSDSKNHEMVREQGGYSSVGNVPTSVTVNPAKTVKAAIAPLYEQELGGGKYSHLTNSEQMVIGGAGDSDQDSYKILNQVIDNEDTIESLVMSSAIETQDEDSLNFSAIPSDPEDDRTKEFLSSVKDALHGDGEIKFGAINSGDMMSAPELQYTVVGSDGKSRRFTIDLSKDTALASEVLGKGSPFYKNLSSTDQKTIEAMMENMDYRGLAVSIGEDQPQFDRTAPNERFSEDQTANVRGYAQQRDREAFGFIPQSTKDPNSRDAYALKNRFFSSDDPDMRYNVEMNSDNSYSSYKKNERTGEVMPFTFKDYLDKEYAAHYLQENARRPDKYPMSFIGKPEQENHKRENYMAYMMELVQNTGNLDEPSKSMIAYNNSSSFKKAVMGIYHLNDRIRNGQTTLEESKDEMDSYIKMIENKTVQSKRPKLIL